MVYRIVYIVYNNASMLYIVQPFLHISRALSLSLSLSISLFSLSCTTAFLLPLSVTTYSVQSRHCYCLGES